MSRSVEKRDEMQTHKERLTHTHTHRERETWTGTHTERRTHTLNVGKNDTDAHHNISTSSEELQFVTIMNKS